jgi:peptidoglycan/xylan/chitin deacetylase (PgdA/CDA1 family)
MLQPVASAISRLRTHRWRGVRFLCYHSVCRTDELATLARRTGVISVDGFRRHLAVMREHDYRVVSMERALALLAKGDAKTGQYVCLTFDDGRHDNFANAWPILRESGCSAHFFVSSGLVGKTVHEGLGHGEVADRYMDAEMLRAIVRDGGSIGSHAHHHVNLTTLGADALRRELRDSRGLLEEMTGGSIRTHAYPWAVYDRDVLAATRDAGYAFAFAGGVGGTVTMLDGRSACLTIPRNTIRSGPDREENYVTLRGGMDVFRPYSTLKLRWRYGT